MCCGGKKQVVYTNKYGLGTYSGSQAFLNAELYFQKNFCMFYCDYETQVIQNVGSTNFLTVKHLGSGVMRKAIHLDQLDKVATTERLFIIAHKLIQIDHPNVVKTIDFYESPKEFYLVQEHCEGTNVLEKLSLSTTTTEKDISVIFNQIFKGLQDLHSREIMHGDLRPGNFMYVNVKVQNDKQGKAQPDQEIVKILNNGAISMLYYEKKLHEIMEVNFFAPECFDNKGTQKSDIWSLGVFLYLLLCGKLPFDGRDFTEIETKVRQGFYSFGEANWDTVSPQAKDLIKLMLNKDPAKRPTCEECLKDLWYKGNPNYTKILTFSTDYSMKRILRKSQAQILVQEDPQGNRVGSNQPAQATKN